MESADLFLKLWGDFTLIIWKFTNVDGPKAAYNLDSWM